MPTRNRRSKAAGRSPKRPQIGFKVDPITGTPSRTQARFNFGCDPKEFDYRKVLVQRLYEENCRENGQACWSPLALSYARLIEKGIYEIPFQIPESVVRDESLTDDERAAEYVFLFRHQQQAYPSLKLIPADEQLYQRGVFANRKFEMDAIQRLYQQLMQDGRIPLRSHVPDRVVTGTLHESFDGYIRHVETTGLKLDDKSLKPSQRKRIAYTETLKEHHPDAPLHELTYDRISEMIGYWTNRPKTKRKTRFKPAAARHILKEFERFLRWLDATSENNWEVPRGLDNINKSFVELEEDHLEEDMLLKTVYTPEQLGLINQYTTNMDRLLLYVGINCAFGAAEVGRLIDTEVLLDHKHEYADRLHFQSTDKDCFVRLKRPKSKMFGEWLLWPETVEVLRWGIRRARRLNSKFIVCTRTGQILYNERSDNPQSTFANRWKKLIQRVQAKHPKFPYLPYGSLRDTLPDLLRHRYQDELASICLAHRTAYKPDRLLEAYGNKPFGRLHQAIREVHSYFEPMFKGELASAKTHVTSQE